MIYGYARVSTIKQKNDGNSLESQEKELKENGATQLFIDSFTGTKMSRPEFQKLLSVIQPGDKIIATKLDRVSRSASQGIALVDELLSKGVTLHILNMGVLDDTPTGKLIRNILFSFAEFERDMIVERTKEGRVVARTKPGYKEGRKPVNVSREQFENLRKKQKEGSMTVAECCKQLNISRATWYNLCKQ